MFFSFPILYPYILYSLILPAYRRGFWVARWDRPWPQIIRAIPYHAVMLAIVHFNTLVHPFTIADNRHYTFYVVRYLLWYPAIKYSVVSIYFICAWVAISALGGLPQNHEASKDRNEENGRRVRGETPRLFGNRVSFVLVCSDVEITSTQRTNGIPSYRDSRSQNHQARDATSTSTRILPLARNGLVPIDKWCDWIYFPELGLRMDPRARHHAKIHVVALVDT